jgi:hypothetical protein
LVGEDFATIHSTPCLVHSQNETTGRTRWREKRAKTFILHST